MTKPYDDPVIREICDVYAVRHGFTDFMDVRPPELMVIIIDDAVAIRDALFRLGALVAGRPLPHPYARGDDAWCVYCSKQYATFKNLQTHLRKVHPDTYGQINLAPDPNEPRTRISL